MLFLLYNAELVRIYSKLKSGAVALGFIDDVNILVYSKSTEANCRLLETIHEEYLGWAERHRLRFAPYKYELIYLTTATKRFDL
jgi:hypothetical protein